jgi:hypothetical protein
MVGMRTRLAIERAGTVTPHLKRGAPVLYPNGIEPSFAGCRPAVLPLNDSPNLVAGWRVERHSHGL